MSLLLMLSKCIEIYRNFQIRGGQFKHFEGGGGRECGTF